MLIARRARFGPSRSRSRLVVLMSWCLQESQVGNPVGGPTSSRRPTAISHRRISQSSGADDRQHLRRAYLRIHIRAEEPLWRRIDVARPTNSIAREGGKRRTASRSQMRGKTGCCDRCGRHSHAIALRTESTSVGRSGVARSGGTRTRSRSGSVVVAENAAHRQNCFGQSAF